LVGTTADFRRFGHPQPLPINHLLCENRRTQGRMGEVGLGASLIWPGAISAQTASPPLIFGAKIPLGEVSDRMITSASMKKAAAAAHCGARKQLPRRGRSDSGQGAAQGSLV
jgi:hypothetical protein